MIRAQKVFRKGVQQGFHQAVQYLRRLAGRGVEFLCHQSDEGRQSLDIRRIKRLVQGKGEGGEQRISFFTAGDGEMDPVIIVIRIITAVVDTGIPVKQDYHVRLRMDAFAADIKPGGSLHDQKQIFREPVFMFDIAGLAVIRVVPAACYIDHIIFHPVFPLLSLKAVLVKDL